MPKAVAITRDDFTAADFRKAARRSKDTKFNAADVGAGFGSRRL